MILFFETPIIRYVHPYVIYLLHTLYSNKLMFYHQVSHSLNYCPIISHCYDMNDIIRKPCAQSIITKGTYSNVYIQVYKHLCAIYTYKTLFYGLHHKLKRGSYINSSDNNGKKSVCRHSIFIGLNIK